MHRRLRSHKWRWGHALRRQTNAKRSTAANMPKTCDIVFVVLRAPFLPGYTGVVCPSFVREVVYVWELSSLCAGKESSTVAKQGRHKTENSS